MPIATNPQTGETVYLSDNGEWLPAQTAVHPQTKQMVVFNGKDWETLEQKRQSGLKTLDDIGRSVAQGATFGWADEASAKVNELIGQGTYEENLAKEKARNKEISPAVSVPGEIAGGVASTLATAPVTGPLAAASGLSKLPAVARGIGVGVPTGALYGAGEAGPDTRLEGAGKGAAMGLATGAVVPPLVGALAKTGGAVRNAVSPQANVSADLGRAIHRDKMTPDQLLQRAQDLDQVRPGVANVADAGGENVRGLVERIAQTPGAGRTVVVPNLTGRQQGQMVRLSNDLSQLTGTRQTATQAITDTMQQRAQSAKPLYEQAFNFNARNVPEINQAWQEATATGWGQAVLRSPDFRKTLQTEYGINNPNDAPLMVVIDAWKKQVDGMVGEAIRSGNNNRARILGDMRDKVVGTVDQHNQAYAVARDAWAGPSRYLDAIEEGRNILNTKIGSEQLTAALGAMSQAEQEAFRIGAVSAIQGRMGNDPAKLVDVTKYFRSPEMRAKVAAIMPTPEARQTWAERLNFEVSASELTGKSLGNSSTARRLAEKQDADSIAGDLVMDAFMGAPPVSLLRQMVTAVPRKLRDTLRSRSDNILAELLTDPQSMQGLVQAIERVSARSRVSPTRNASVVRASNAALISEDQ